MSKYFNNEYFKFKIKLKVGLFDILLEEYIYTRNNKLNLNLVGVYETESFSKVINEFIYKNTHFIKDTVFVYLHKLTSFKPEKIDFKQESCFDKMLSNKNNLELTDSALKFYELIKDLNLINDFNEQDIKNTIDNILEEVTDFKDTTRELVNNNLQIFDKRLKEYVTVEVKPEDVKNVILIKKIIYGVLLFKIGIIFFYLIYLVYCLVNIKSINYSRLVNFMIGFRYILVLLLIIFLASSYIFTDVSKPILIIKIIGLKLDQIFFKKLIS